MNTLTSDRLATRNVLPRRVRTALWGDRSRWGLVPDVADPTWREWQDRYGEFYDQTQQEGIGRVVNAAGHTVMSQLDISDRILCEIGPGSITHIRHWRGRPSVVHLVDVDDRMAKVELVEAWPLRLLPLLDLNLVIRFLARKQMP